MPSYRDVEMKVCEKHPELNGRRYKRGTCPGCIKAASVAHYKANKEKRKEQIAEWQAANKQKMKAATIKYQSAYKEAHPLYSVWKNMKKRCSNPKTPLYHRYGGRGISVCAEWLSFDAFELWGLASGYQRGLQLDRINNDGNYCPDNCRWASREINMRNSTATKLNEQDVGLIRSMLAIGARQRHLAEQFGIGKSLVAAVSTGKVWRDVAPLVAY